MVPLRSRAEPPEEPLWRDLVGRVLRRERVARGLRLRDVAERARVSVPYLSELERGRKEASSEVLAAVADALGLRLVGLLALTQAELARATTSHLGGVHPLAGPRQARPSVPPVDGQPRALARTAA